jgi:ribosomal protein S18 acetylase RimI-like enzyme
MRDIEKLAIKNILGNNYICHFNKTDWGEEILIMKIDGLAFSKIYWYNDKYEGTFENTDEFNKIYLSSLSVDESIRKQGVGNELLNKFQTIAFYLIRKELFLWCLDNSWISEWYKREGFKYFDEHTEMGYIWLTKNI